MVFGTHKGTIPLRILRDNYIAFVYCQKDSSDKENTW